MKCIMKGISNIGKVQNRSQKWKEVMNITYNKFMKIDVIFFLLRKKIKRPLSICCIVKTIRNSTKNKTQIF